MANKNYRSTVYKRAIDVGQITTPLANDLVKIWRDAEGDEKAISLADLAVGVILEGVHNDLTGLQGGSSTERYHLTLAQHTALHGAVTIGTPANGLSLVGQELSLGLASSGVTGALSGTDWSTFNGKIGGSLTSGRIPFATGANTLSDDSALTWNNTSKILTVDGKFFNNFTETSILSARPTIQELRYFANPSSGPVAGTDFHGVDLFYYTQGSNINSNTRIYPLESAVSHLTTQTLGKAVPLYGFARNSANGNINEVSNIRLYTANVGTGTITTVKSIEINNPENSGGGLISNFFGLHIENITNAVSAWGVYDLSSRSYFAGNIGVGQTSILAKIHARGIKDILAVESTSSDSFQYFGNDVSGTIGDANGLTVGLSGLNAVINNREAGEIQLSTSNTLRWSVLSNGIMQSNGAGIIQSSSGNFTFRSAPAGNTSVVIDAFGSGKYIFTNDQGNIEILKQASTIDFTRAGINYIRAITAGGSLRITTNANLFTNPAITASSSNTVGINTDTPTNTLDVNGTVRIRSISNAVGNFLTTSATGVVQQRTAGETRVDIGANAALSVDINNALTGANLPSSTNVIATMDDISDASGVPTRQVFVYVASNIFTLSFSNPTVIYVSLNGQVLEEGALYDWTVSGTSLTVTTPLRAGDEISVLYYVDLPMVTNYGRNIDGGVPDSVYLAIQNVDGGTP